MDFSRRDFLMASSAVAAALGMQGAGLFRLQQAMAKEAAQGGLLVIWLQGQCCSGCSVSLLNSIYYNTIDGLLLNTLDLNYHPTVMAAAGDMAVAAAEDTYNAGNYVLVVEGAIPTKSGGMACSTWHGMPMLTAVKRYASRAAYIIGAGTCACYGGMAAGAPNPTGARGLGNRLMGKTVVCIPGCPVHPDWVVGTIAYILANGHAPTLDTYNRPTDYYAATVHSHCPFRSTDDGNLGRPGCLEEIGCKGPRTYSDCPVRRWNSGAANQYGTSWCIGTTSPCIGCTQPTFPDGMKPFYRLTGG